MNPHDKKWFNRYLELAQFWADQCSKDPTTKVGAVVVGANPHHIALGYNGFPPGVNDLEKRYADRPTKYLFTQHAERNAMDNAPFDCRGGTLATTLFPCVECAKSMVSKGFKCLVSPPPPEPLAVASWRDTIPTAQIILAEGGVRVVLLECGEEVSYPY